RAMAAYDATRRPSMETLAADTRAALERFFAALTARDTAAAEACLADGARLVSDGGGEFRAALRPVVGAGHVTRFFLGLARKLGLPSRFDVRSMNGLPALVVEYEDHPRPANGPARAWARRFVVRCDVDARGLIEEVHVLLASPKLARVR
ncbi:MAG TPA: RNA polymerase subunit sigma, partial [Polyangiaceae bacterium]|nr:RNA polymerase subunit sigma [Polyangiaceae bacterium]